MQEEELESLGFHAEGMRKVRNATSEGRKEGADLRVNGYAKPMRVLTGGRWCVWI